MPPRRTWFSHACVEYWRERNDPAYIRSKILARDKGICVLCSCDAQLEFKKAKEQYSEAHRLLCWLERRADDELRKLHHYKLPASQVTQLLWPDAVDKNGRMNFDKLHKLRDKEARHWCPAADAGWTLSRHEGWDVDHIIPVIEGGGQCGLDSLRTLCHPCHKAVTRELAHRRRKPVDQPASSL